MSAPPYEISIEVSEDDLRRHGMTFDQVADAVRRSSLDLPGGSVRMERGEILLRTMGRPTAERSSRTWSSGRGPTAAGRDRHHLQRLHIGAARASPIPPCGGQPAARRGPPELPSTGAVSAAARPAACRAFSRSHPIDQPKGAGGKRG